MELFLLMIIFQLTFINGMQLKNPKSSRLIFQKFDVNKTHKKSHNVVNLQAFSPGHIVLLETTKSERIENSKIAAISLLNSFSEDSRFSIILCDKSPLTIAEEVTKSKGIDFITSSNLGTSSYVAEGYETAKILVKKRGVQNVFLISSDKNKLKDNRDTAIKESFIKLGFTFSFFIIDNEFGGTLYFFKLKKIITYTLPNFKVPFGIFQTRRNSVVNYISLDNKVPSETVASDTGVFVINSEIKILPYDISYESVIENFINMEFDPEWYINNTDLEYIFPQEDTKLAKLRLYTRYQSPKDENKWVNLRMNDRGLEPDSIIDDKVYTTALYCKDLMTIGFYEFNFLLMDLDYSVAKIFLGSACRVKSVGSQCLVDKILPAQVTDIKCFKTSEMILCILIAVGGDGMRHLVTHYQGVYVQYGIAKENKFNCTSNKNPFEILCCKIINPPVNLSQTIMVKLQAIDDSKNVGKIPKWTMAQNKPIPIEVCNRTVVYKTTVSSFCQTLCIRLYETIFYFILFMFYNCITFVIE